ncbi:hypothetical protein [Chamaesiphon sp.]|uniref:hypothetical protein n=1 Tax=Chamaesiphon sp. TaxID=2814140 RepID=UPI0035942E12
MLTIDRHPELWKPKAMARRSTRSMPDRLLIAANLPFIFSSAVTIEIATESAFTWRSRS